MSIKVRASKNLMSFLICQSTYHDNNIFLQSFQSWTKKHLISLYRSIALSIQMSTPNTAHLAVGRAGEARWVDLLCLSTQLGLVLFLSVTPIVALTQQKYYKEKYVIFFSEAFGNASKRMLWAICIAFVGKFSAVQILNINKKYLSVVE